MAGTAATVSVLGLIVFGTLASLLGKIGEQHFHWIRTILYMPLYIAKRHVSYAYSSMQVLQCTSSPGTTLTAMRNCSGAHLQKEAVSHRSESYGTASPWLVSAGSLGLQLRLCSLACHFACLLVGLTNTCNVLRSQAKSGQTPSLYYQLNRSASDYPTHAP